MIGKLQRRGKWFLCGVIVLGMVITGIVYSQQQKDPIKICQNEALSRIAHKSDVELPKNYQPATEISPGVFQFQSYITVLAVNDTVYGGDYVGSQRGHKVTRWKNKYYICEVTKNKITRFEFGN